MTEQRSKPEILLDLYRTVCASREDFGPKRTEISLSEHSQTPMREVTNLAQASGSHSQNEKDKSTRHELRRMIAKAKPEDYLDCLDRMEDEDRCEYLRALFQASDVNAPVFRDFHNATLEKAVQLLNLGRISARYVGSFVQLVSAELRSLDPTTLARIVNSILDGLRRRTETTSSPNEAEHNKACELLPHLVSCAEPMSSIPAGPGANVEGTEFKAYVLRRLCHRSWQPALVPTIVPLIGEFQLTPPELKLAVDKIFEEVQHLDMMQLPPLVYQLLLLCKQGCKVRVLEGILSIFSSYDQGIERAKRILDQQRQAVLSSRPAAANDGPNSELEEEEDRKWTEAGDRLRAKEKRLRETQGVCLLHLTFAIKQDMALGRKLLLPFKGDGRGPLEPFALAVLLAASRIPRHESRILKELQTIVGAHCKDRVDYASSTWIQSVLDGDADDEEDEMDYDRDRGDNQQQQETGEKRRRCLTRPMEDDLRAVVRNSSFGWDSVVEALVNLGVALLDGSGASSLSPIHMEDSDVAQRKQNLVVEVAFSVILDTFEQHRIARPLIMEQIVSRVMVRPNNLPLYIRLLKCILRQDNGVTRVSEHITRLKEAFEYMPLLPHGPACALLEAARPLMAAGSSPHHAPSSSTGCGFQDHVVLVLRKSLFSRELDTRRVAVTGFIQLLRGLEEAGSSSPAARRANEAVRFEVLGFLRRCLGQQPCVRSALYRGLVQIFEEADDSGSNSDSSSSSSSSSSSRRALSPTREVILDVLLSHFEQFYEGEDKTLTPLLLEKAVDRTRGALVEPLGDLLHCIQRCASIQSRTFQMIDGDESGNRSSDEDNSHPPPYRTSFDVVSDKLKKLVTLTVNCELEQFDLDPSSPFSSDSNEGAFTRQASMVLRGCYEALIEYSVMFVRDAKAFSSAVRLFGLRANLIKAQMTGVGQLKKVAAAIPAGMAKKKGKGKAKAAGPLGSSSSSNPASNKRKICAAFNQAVTKVAPLFSLALIDEILQLSTFDAVAAKQDGFLADDDISMKARIHGLIHVGDNDEFLGFVLDTALLFFKQLPSLCGPPAWHDAKKQALSTTPSTTTSTTTTTTTTTSSPECYSTSGPSGVPYWANGDACDLIDTVDSLADSLGHSFFELFHNLQRDEKFSSAFCALSSYEVVARFILAWRVDEDRITSFFKHAVSGVRVAHTFESLSASARSGRSSSRARMDGGMVDVSAKEVHSYLEKLERMAHKCIVDANFREAQVLLNLIGRLVPRLAGVTSRDAKVPASSGVAPDKLVLLTVHRKWLEKEMTRCIEDLPFSQTLSRLYMLVARTANSIHDMMLRYTKDAISFVDNNQSSGFTQLPVSQRPERMEAVNQKTQFVSFEVLLSNVSECIDEVGHISRWIQSHALAFSKGDSTIGTTRSSITRHLVSAKTRDLVYGRIDALVEILHRLAVSDLPVPGKGATFTATLYKCLKGVYQLMFTIVRNLVRTSTVPSVSCQELIDKVGGSLNVGVYEFFSLSESSMYGVKNKPKASTLRKEAHARSELVAIIEKFEVNVIKVGDACKMNLMHKFKRSVARDFRVNSSKLKRTIAAKEEKLVEEARDIERIKRKAQAMLRNDDDEEMDDVNEEADDDDGGGDDDSDESGGSSQAKGKKRKTVAKPRGGEE